MNRLVYLFELDSVRNSEKEINIGQWALFREVVVDGNVVVMTFNQLADGEVFLNLLKEDKTYKMIVSLFQMKRICVSRFRDYRTPSHYVQEAIDKCLNGTQTFVFSGLPITSEDKDVLEKMKQALQYNDIACLEEMIQEKRASGTAVSDEDKKAIDDDIERLEFIVRYVKLMLTLGIENLANNPVKEEGLHDMKYFMNLIFNRDYSKFSEEIRNNTHIDWEYSKPNDEEFFEYYLQAIEYLKNLYTEIASSNEQGLCSRSVWIKQIYLQDKDCEEAKCQMANAIIDMCYNYVVEDSVLGINKRYNIEEEDSFFGDFIIRICQYWNCFENDTHKPTTDDKNMKENVETEVPWETAVRIIDSFQSKKKQEDISDYKVKDGIVDNQIRNLERKKWMKKLRRNVTKSICFAILYMGLFLLVEMIMGGIEGIVTEKLGLPSILNDIFSIVVFGIVGSLVFERLPIEIPDILQSFRNISTYAKDAYTVYKVEKSNKE